MASIPPPCSLLNNMMEYLRERYVYDSLSVMSLLSSGVTGILSITISDAFTK